MYKNINGQNLSTKERKALTKEAVAYGLDPQYFSIEAIPGSDNNARVVKYDDPSGETIIVGHMITVHEGEWMNIIIIDPENKRRRIGTIPMPDNPADWSVAVANFMVVCHECDDTKIGPVIAGANNSANHMLYFRVPGLFALAAQYSEWEPVPTLH